MAKIICTKILFLLTTAYCARILVVLPSAFYSHQLPMKLLYKELSLRGHKVVAITTFPFNDSSLKNLTEINIGYINRYIQNVSFVKLATQKNIFINTYQYFTSLGDVAEEIFADPRIKKLLNDKKVFFDLVIVEWCSHPAFGAISQRFKSPLVGFRSMELRPACHEVIGNPTNPSYIPTGSTDFELTTFFGRFHNFLIYTVQVLLHKFVMLPRARSILEKHTDNYSISIEEAERNISIVIANTHSLLNGARPVVPSYIQVPGIHLHEKDEPRLPVEIAEFLDYAEEGVIYINFGSVFHGGDLEGKQLHILVSALSKLQQHVLWKLTGSNFVDLPRNIKMVKWVDQKAVLAHENVKLFVTHGGLLSYQEAVHFKVPLVGVPFVGDQFVNINRMVELQIGKRLDYFSMTEEEAILTLREVIENSMYRERISKISDMLEDQEGMTAMERAIWWIEYVLRHRGAPHMKSISLNLNVFQYLLLDIIAFLLIIVISATVLFYKLIKFFKYKKIYMSNGKKKPKTE